MKELHFSAAGTVSPPRGARRASATGSAGWPRTVAEALSGLAVLLGLWLLASLTIGKDLPTPAAVAATLAELLSSAFDNTDLNDKGVLIQVAASLGRVFTGFFLGSLVALPLGLLMGATPITRRMINPVVQILRPVSPLAWFPIGLAVFHTTGPATIFVIFITSLWPTVINTALGVSSVPDDYKNVARVFHFSRWKYTTQVMVPHSLPYVVTGLRLSMGIAWMVIVAAEMLSGGAGIGFFVWESWNALSLERVMSAIALIGVIGLLLDRLFDLVQKKVTYDV